MLLPGDSVVFRNALGHLQTSSSPGSSCPPPLWPDQSETASPPATSYAQFGVFARTADTEQHFLLLTFSYTVSHLNQYLSSP